MATQVQLVKSDGTELSPVIGANDDSHVYIDTDNRTLQIRHDGGGTINIEADQTNINSLVDGVFISSDMNDLGGTCPTWIGNTSAELNLYGSIVKINGEEYKAGTTYEEATTSTAGLMSAADKTKLDELGSSEETIVSYDVDTSATTINNDYTLSDQPKKGTIHFLFQDNSETIVIQGIGFFYLEDNGNLYSHNILWNVSGGEGTATDVLLLESQNKQCIIRVYNKTAAKVNVTNILRQISSFNSAATTPYKGTVTLKYTV